MNLFTLLESLDPEATPNRCKLHLAGWNGKEDPLDVYLEGGFDKWQSVQRHQNFSRDFVRGPHRDVRSGPVAVRGASHSAGGEKRHRSPSVPISDGAATRVRGA